VISDVGQRERKVQDRIIRLFAEQLGYQYIGRLPDANLNSNVRSDVLRAWLLGQGHDERLVTRAIEELQRRAAIGAGRGLYDANEGVYQLLRYGYSGKVEAGAQTEHLALIDWSNPTNNTFEVAEEVAISGKHGKRPDVALYVNGIAVAVLELKRSTVSVSEGIRQMLDNQQPEFIEPFFTTQQLLLAGNDTEGLRYGTIQTPEKYWLTWREPVEDSAQLLDDGLAQLCRPARLLELLHDFVVFDAGTKKLARHNQYLGVKAAQARIEEREGGIIWHTQGSGKSLTMVWLAKWIRENQPEARVLIVTDREELDEQIEKVFLGVNEQIHRTASGDGLLTTLRSSEEWLVCSLVHKFGSADEDTLADQIEKAAAGGFKAAGNLFVFVDECHRTQSGKLNQAMRTLLPDAMFIGFTGTPLLKADKARSIEVFGSYIHTYRFDEAVRDGVVLDLVYEARDIEQRLTSNDKVDRWFDAKTKGLSTLARAELKKRWGTLQKVLTSTSRLNKIVSDILLDFETRDRLMSGRGNALLVCSSIYEACKYYEAFSKTDLDGKCAIITSYRPTADEIKGEESGEGRTEALEKYDTYRKMVAGYFDAEEDEAAALVEDFEKKVKEKFIHQPGQMKLLIVVDKLLTGFDAPSATYLYIDKKMQDHGLFQAICRVNRLDGEDKTYGCIVDYQDLFNSLEGAVNDYTSGAFDAYDHGDVAGLVENRLERAKQRLDEAREAIKALCEPAGKQPDTQDYLRYFCSATPGDAAALKGNEPKRLKLYKLTATYTRAYAELANEMEEAGYSDNEAATVKAEVAHYDKLRSEIKLASGDAVDLKRYEPAMRHLLNSYIEADESQIVSDFDDKGLVQLIVERGPEAIDTLPDDIRSNEDVAAETIVNNVRKVIIDETPVNPKYYEKMSALLDDLLEQRRRKALDYKQYLKELAELAGKVADPSTHTSYPDAMNTAAKRALYDTVGGDEALAVALDEAIRDSKRDDWRGHPMKERAVRRSLAQVVAEASGRYDVDELLEIVKAQHEY